MKVKIQIIVESDNGDTQVAQEIMLLERGSLQPENLGLKLAEAKTLLQNLQRTLAEQQVAEYSLQQEFCLQCNQKLLHKDKRTIVYRTLFGKLHLKCPRLFHCPCQEQPTRSFNPVANLLPERTSRELLYLESKFASLMSYGLWRCSTKINVLDLHGICCKHHFQNCCINGKKRFNTLVDRTQWFR